MVDSPNSADCELMSIHFELKARSEGTFADAYGRRKERWEWETAWAAN